MFCAHKFRRCVDDSDEEGPHTCIIEVFLAPDNINPFATIQGNITDNDGTPPDDDDDGGAAWWGWALIFGGAAAGIIWAATRDSNSAELGGGGVVISPSF